MARRRGLVGRRINHSGSRRGASTAARGPAAAPISQGLARIPPGPCIVRGCPSQEALTMAFVGNSAASRDIAYAIHPYTNLKVHETEGPLVITRGEGVFIYDDSGKQYLEGLAGLWCASLGFSEQRLAEAAYAQMKTLPYYHIFASKSHDVG